MKKTQQDLKDERAEEQSLLERWIFCHDVDWEEELVKIEGARRLENV